jgi:hypothetical protein
MEQAMNKNADIVLKEDGKIVFLFWISRSQAILPAVPAFDYPNGQLP